MNGKPISRKEFFLIIGRSFIRSRIGRAIIALGIAALTIWLAIIGWRGREIIGGVAVVIFVYFGLSVAAAFIPWSESTLARREYQRQLAERYPSYRLRRGLHTGAGMLIYYVLKGCFRQHFQPDEFLIPGVFTLVGAIAEIIWRRKGISDEPEEA